MTSVLFDHPSIESDTVPFGKEVEIETIQKRAAVATLLLHPSGTNASPLLLFAQKPMLGYPP